MNQEFYDIALDNYSDSKYSMALFSIQEYLSLNPDNKPGRLLLGLIYGELSNYKRSFEILDEIKPNEFDNKTFQKLYLSQMGDNNKKIGNLDLAIEFYDKYIEIDPESANGYIFKGACLALKGEYGLAKEQHLIATKLKGHPEEAFYNLALICRAEMNFEKAKKYCESSLKIDPKDEIVRHCLDDINEAIEMKRKQLTKA